MSDIKVAVFGEALFDMIQQDNGDYRPFIGGSPYNVARSFARQGLDCHYLSPISTDYLGEQIYQSVLEENIQVPADNRSVNTTSLALVYKDAQGLPDYRLYRKSVADLDIAAEKLLDSVPKDLTLLHTGSLALVPDMLDVLLSVMTELKQRGVKISVDVNVRKGVERDHQQYVSAIWQFVKLANIVKVSDEDIQLMGMEGDCESNALSLLSHMQQGIVVLTEGEKGAQLFTQQKHIKQKVHQPEIFADTVGAGDTFFSAMIAQLLRDKALQPDADNEKLAFALRFASLAAALNISHVGCHPPTYSQVAALL